MCGPEPGGQRRQSGGCRGGGGGGARPERRLGTQSASVGRSASRAQLGLAAVLLPRRAGLSGKAHEQQCPRCLMTPHTLARGGRWPGISHVCGRPVKQSAYGAVLGSRLSFLPVSLPTAGRQVNVHLAGRPGPDRPRSCPKSQGSDPRGQPEARHPTSRGLEEPWSQGDTASSVPGSQSSTGSRSPHLLSENAGAQAPTPTGTHHCRQAPGTRDCQGPGV